MTLQEKIAHVRDYIFTPDILREYDEIQAEVSQLQTANSVILGHVHALESAVRAYCPEYAVMSKEDDGQGKRIAELEALARQWIWDEEYPSPPPEPEVCHMPELVSVLEEQEIGGTIRNWTVSSSKHEHPLAVYRLVQVHPDFATHKKTL